MGDSEKIICSNVLEKVRLPQVQYPMKNWLKEGLADPLTLVRTEAMGVDVGVMVDMVAGGFASSLLTD